MVKQRKSGKLVFVSSVVGLMSFQGYCSYAPGKTAIRGLYNKDARMIFFSRFQLALSETLEQELRLYDIGVSCYFPATIYSPGFEEELAVKPGPQRKIEEADGGITPDKAATVLLKGV
jgi:3-dehydrosphinganine reductase